MHKNTGFILIVVDSLNFCYKMGQRYKIILIFLH